MLSFTAYGEPRAGIPPLLIAHGLFGSGRNWGALARRFAAARQVLAVDMRNHAESFHAADHGYPALAEDLAEVIAAHGGRADLLGHSMGGKAAMWLALHHPEMVARLIVADIAPVRYGHSQMEVITALRGLDLAALTSRREADAALAERMTSPVLRGFLLQSLDLTARPPRWRLNLDALAANMDALTGFPETEASWSGPALFLAGETSDYVRPGHEPAILRHFPAARIDRIAEAGHWLHAERPGPFAEAVEGFLDSA